MPEYLGGYELGPMVAVQGKEGCTDPRCTRMRDRETGEWGVCIGWHCPRCGEPCSMMGHRNCPKLDPRA